MGEAVTYSCVKAAWPLEWGTVREKRVCDELIALWVKNLWTLWETDGYIWLELIQFVVIGILTTSSFAPDSMRGGAQSKQSKHPSSRNCYEWNCAIHWFSNCLWAQKRVTEANPYDIVAVTRVMIEPQTKQQAGWCISTWLTRQKQLPLLHCADRMFSASFVIVFYPLCWPQRHHEWRGAKQR